MKKVYNQPSIMVVHLKPCRLMEDSHVPVSSNDFNSNTQTIGAKGGFGGWDDEEPGEDY